MTYKEVIKKLESIGLEIDYDFIDKEVKDLEKECENPVEFESKIRAQQK
jgi:hypothetical protein